MLSKWNVGTLCVDRPLNGEPFDLMDHNEDNRHRSLKIDRWKSLDHSAWQAENCWEKTCNLASQIADCRLLSHFSVKHLGEKWKKDCKQDRHKTNALLRGSLALEVDIEFQIQMLQNWAPIIGDWRRWHLIIMALYGSIWLYAGDDGTCFEVSLDYFTA